MIDLYIMHIGAEVNDTSLKNAGQENSVSWELMIWILLYYILYKKNMTLYKH